MKKIFFALALLTGLQATAQSNKEDVDLIQSLYGKDKKLIVSNFIKLAEPQKTSFWALYDAYETERKAIGAQRLAFLEKYAKSYDNLDDATTDQLINENISIAKKNDQLIQAYYKKLKKAAGVKAAAQFFQIENYFLYQIRSALLESIPFIDELK